jgi:hypothetical protein
VVGPLWIKSTGIAVQWRQVQGHDKRMYVLIMVRALCFGTLGSDREPWRAKERSMTKTLNRLGDRLLGVFLPKADAGACVPDHGDRCGCYKYSCSCVGVDVQRCYWRYKLVSCTGPCSTWSSFTCNTTYEVNYNC